MAIDPERHSRTMAAVVASSLDVIVCTSATDVLLLTGYWPVMASSVAVFPSNGRVRVIVPEDEAELAKATSSADTVPYKPADLHSFNTPLTHLIAPLRSALSELSATKMKARVGIQLDLGVQPASYAVSTVFRASLAALLAELWPQAELVKCDALLETMKAVKTGKELEILRTASRVAATGFAAAEVCIEAGKCEKEVAAAAQAAFEITREADPFQRSYGYFFCMSGPNSATADAAYARTRNRVIEAGDLVMIHANTCADGYWTDITRTFTAGKPTSRHLEIRSAIQEARAAGLRSIRPGVTGSEVDHAVRSVMQSRGYGQAFKHAAGHGVGFAAANANGRPRIHPLSPDVLEEGMTFNLEPAAYFDGYGGARHCDVIAVTAQGASVITEF